MPELLANNARRDSHVHSVLATEVSGLPVTIDVDNPATIITV